MFNVDSFQGNGNISSFRLFGRLVQDPRGTGDKKCHALEVQEEYGGVSLLLQNGGAVKTHVGRFAEEYIPRTAWVALEDLTFHW